MTDTDKQNTQTKYNSEKQATQNTARQCYTGSVSSDDTRSWSEMGLFYNAPEPTYFAGAEKELLGEQNYRISLAADNGLVTGIWYLVTE